MIASSFESVRPNAIAGRDREIAFLRAALDRAVDGAGTLVLIGGEAGIGKTRIVEELQTFARNAGVLVLAGHCFDLPTQAPYSPWLTVLSDTDLNRIVPGVSSALNVQANDQSALHGRVVQHLTQASGKQPLLIVLEDLHWATRSSLELLRLVAREARRLPLFVIATYRNDQLTRQDDLYSILPLLVRESRADRIELPRLDETATARIVAQHYALSDLDQKLLTRHVFERSQGNPLYVEEILLALQEANLIQQSGSEWAVDASLFSTDLYPVPMLIRQVIEQRIDLLSQPARKLIDVASICGVQIDLDLWQELSGLDEARFVEVSGEVLESHFIDEAPGTAGLQFRHAIFRETLYRSIVLPERIRLHRIAAEFLERTGSDPDTIAHHFAIAGDPRAVGWLTQAGERALALYAPETALAHFSRAIDIAGSGTNSVAPEPFLGRGRAYMTTGAFSSALDDLTTALQLARDEGNQHVEWHSLTNLGSLWAERDYAQTRKYNQEALELARSIGDASIIGHSLSRVSNWYLNSNEPDLAIEFAQEALGYFRSVGDLTSEASLTRMLAMEYLVQGDLMASDRRFREAIDAYRLVGDRHGLCSAMTGLIYTTGTYTFHTEIPGPASEDEVSSLGGEALQIASESGWRAGEAYVYLALGSQRGIRGRYSNALEHTETGLEIATGIDHREWMALGHQILGRIHLDLFDLPAAERHLETSLSIAERVGAPLHRRLAGAYLAHIHIARGELDRALERLESDFDLNSSSQTVIGRKVSASRALVALASGDPELALAMIDALLDTTRNRRDDVVVPFFGRLRGEALTRLGRFDEADSQLQAALATADSTGYQPVVWRIQAALGRLCTEADRDQDAARWFSDSRSTIAALANDIPDERLRNTFVSEANRRIPAPRPMTRLQAAKQQYQGLTARQRDVARLIGDGCTNAEIADQLSISERTAESHVAAILKKLGFSSRSQIAVWAAERKLSGPRRH
jgi:DNA-binding CsgD family transcriptional regulator